MFLPYLRIDPMSVESLVGRYNKQYSVYILVELKHYISELSKKTNHYEIN